MLRADGDTQDLLRDLAPQVLGALVRRYGHFDTAEDAVQEALLAAIAQWPKDGRPDNPKGWLIRVGSRRWFLQTGLAGVAGLSLPDLLRCRAEGKGADRKAVILIWLSGGPSQLDTWDPKPNAPREVRGPFGSVATKVPGVRVCEHLPRQAAILDRLALVRSVDCRASTDHYPAPMQAGNPLAQRTMVGATAATHPSMGSVAAP